MKRRLYILAICILLLGIAGCGKDTVELVEVEIEQIPEGQRRDDAVIANVVDNDNSQEIEAVLEGDGETSDGNALQDDYEEVVISSETKSADGRNIIRIAVVGSPASDIIELADKTLEYSDYCLEAVEFKNYKEVNDRIRRGDIFGSLCENQVLLESYNNINDSNLALADRVFISPMAIFPGKGDSIKNITAGATIAVAKGDVNVARALYLLEQKGLIEVKEGAMYQATMENIVANPYNISLEQVDLDLGWPGKDAYTFVISDYNRAVLNGIDPMTSLGEENRNSKIFDLFVVGLVVNGEDLESEKTKLVLKAINSDEVEDMIENNFYNSVLDYK